MQVKGGKQVTLTGRSTFYEGPDDVHVVGRNAKPYQAASCLVFFVKDKALRYSSQQNNPEMAAGSSRNDKSRIWLSLRRKGDRMKALQQARQGWTLCCVGTTTTPFRRGARRLRSLR